MWSAADIATLVAAFGGLRGAEAIIRALWTGLSEKGQRRRSETDRAWRQADKEARKRRIAERHAGLMERMLIAAPCIDTATIPPWPSYGTDTGETSIRKEKES